MSVFKKYQGSKLIKAILLLIIASFLVAGIGVLRDDRSSNNWVIKAGNYTVSLTDWQRSLQNAIHQKRNYNPDFASGTDEAITRDLATMYPLLLHDLVRSSLFLEEAKDLGATISNQAAADYIRNMTMFLDEDGQFSEEKLLHSLESNSSSKSLFIKKVVENNSRNNLFRILFDNNHFISPALRGLLIQAFYSKHNVALYKIQAQDINLDQFKPSKEELIDFYNQHHDDFYTNESRNIDYIKLDTSHTISQANTSITNDNIEQYYQDNTDRYVEERSISIKQVVCNDIVCAKAAVLQFKQNNNFDNVIKKYSMYNNDVEAKRVYADDLPPELSTTLFNMAKNTISKPFQSDLGWHIFYIDNVNPYRIKPLNEVKTEIKQHIRQDRQSDAVTALIEEINSDLAHMPLQEAIDKYPLTKYKINHITADGKVMQTHDDSHSNIDPDLLNEIAQIAFSLEEEGEKSDLIISNTSPSQEANIFLVQVNNIIHKSLPQFEDVAQKVEQQFKNGKRAVVLMHSINCARQDLQNKRKAELSNNQEEEHSNDASDQMCKDWRTELASNNISIAESTPTSTDMQFDYATSIKDGVSSNVLYSIMKMRVGEISQVECTPNIDLCYFIESKSIDYLDNKQIHEIYIKDQAYLNKLYTNIPYQAYLHYLYDKFDTKVNKNILQQPQ